MVGVTESNRGNRQQLLFRDKLMCIDKNSGNFVMRQTVWCDTLYWKKISTPEIHCQLMLVYGDGVLKPHHLWRGCREFKSELASIMKFTTFSPADQEHVNTMPVVELYFLKTKTQFKI